LKDDIGEIFVVCPALTDSGLAYMFGDVDEAIPPARERLQASALRRAGEDLAQQVPDGGGGCRQHVAARWPAGVRPPGQVAD
jgi:hypothetical protein